MFSCYCVFFLNGLTEDLVEVYTPCVLISKTNPVQMLKDNDRQLVVKRDEGMGVDFINVFSSFGSHELEAFKEALDCAFFLCPAPSLTCKTRYYIAVRKLG